MTIHSPDPAASGERIERLLEASAAAGPVARERAEELVRTVVELYGAGLERVLELAYEAGALDDDLLGKLASDELVSSLLLVHGLHPYPVEDRVENALVDVRPYLGSHGGDIELVEVTDKGVVRLQMKGSCDGCASSAATLELAVEGAIRAAAPEVVAIEVQEAAPKESAGVIPIEQLTARLRTADKPEGGVSWVPAITLDSIAVGGLRQVNISGSDVILCRLRSGVYAYRDACASCGESFAGGLLESAPGVPGSGILTCRSCGAHYDIRRAGIDVAEAERHLEPVPLLERDGVVEIALRAARAEAVPA